MGVVRDIGSALFGGQQKCLKLWYAFGVAVLKKDKVTIKGQRGKGTEAQSLRARLVISLVWLPLTFVPPE